MLGYAADAVKDRDRARAHRDDLRRDAMANPTQGQHRGQKPKSRRGATSGGSALGRIAAAIGRRPRDRGCLFGGAAGEKEKHRAGFTATYRLYSSFRVRGNTGIPRSLPGLPADTPIIQVVWGSRAKSRPVLIKPIT